MGALAFVLWWQSPESHEPGARLLRRSLIRRGALAIRYDLAVNR